MGNAGLVGCEGGCGETFGLESGLVNGVPLERLYRMDDGIGRVNGEL